MTKNNIPFQFILRSPKAASSGANATKRVPISRMVSSKRSQNLMYVALCMTGNCNFHVKRHHRIGVFWREFPLSRVAYFEILGFTASGAHRSFVFASRATARETS